MTWTPKPPTDPGFYWRRSAGAESQVVVEVAIDPDTAQLVVWWTGRERPSPMAHFLTGEWAGPITPPPG